VSSLDHQPTERSDGFAPRAPGRFAVLGGATAACVVLADQAAKLWLLFGLDLENHGRVPLAPWLDLVLTWNPGISYGLFRQHAALGRWLLFAFALAAVGLLSAWLARSGSRLTALALGLIIGGAIGNAIDRLAYGAVVDFVFFHITFPSWEFRWYVFNLADAAIVAGVIGLLYETLIGERAQKAP
jgi:signal peptidase II